jgi:hypothetical protein
MAYNRGVERVKAEPEYAVYKGEDLIVMGTKYECAEKLNVKPDTIVWLTYPTAKRRLAARKRPERCTTVIRLDDEE